VPTGDRVVTGIAVPVTTSLGPAEVYKISPSPGRIALIFWSTSGEVFLYPQNEGVPPTTGLSWGLASEPITLHRDTHDAAVELGWTITAGVGLAVVTFIEVFDPARLARFKRRRLPVVVVPRLRR
jgi:hypothetical protein